jgi:hypothetical protein
MLPPLSHVYQQAGSLILSSYSRLCFKKGTLTKTDKDLEREARELPPFFSQVLLLSASGRQMYCGPREGLVRYFNSIGRPCPQNRSFPDHMLRIVSADDADLEKASETRLEASSETRLETSSETRLETSSETPLETSLPTPVNPMLKDCSESLGNGALDGTEVGPSMSSVDNPKKARANLGSMSEESNSGSSPAETSGNSEYLEDALNGPPQVRDSNSASSTTLESPKPKRLHLHTTHRSPPMRRSFMTQLLVLYKRELINIARNPGLLLTHVVVSALLGLLVGGVYYQVSGKLDGFQNRAGAFYFTLIFLALSR